MVFDVDVYNPYMMAVRCPRFRCGMDIADQAFLDTYEEVKVDLPAAKVGTIQVPARVEYLTRIGLWRMIREEGIGPIVAALSCDYRRPLEYPDEVRIGAHVTSIGNTSFKMAHRIVSVRHGLLAAEVNSALVVLDYKTKKPVRVPDHIRKAIQEIEGKVFA